MPRSYSVTVPAVDDRANEDAVQISDQVVVVVDGAGLPGWMRAGCVHTVQWFASAIALEFHRTLTARTGSMADALAVAITRVAGSHGEQCDLAAGSPSATVAAWRISGAHLEYLVLCDASLLLTDHEGESRTITDDRLRLAGERAGIPDSLAHAGSIMDGEAIRAARREMLERTRNRPDGFWCVQDDPSAARYALCGKEQLTNLETVVAISDGASRAYDLLKVMTPSDLAAQAVGGRLHQIAEAVRAAEDERAGDLTRLGMKVHDDFTIVATRV